MPTPHQNEPEQTLGQDQAALELNRRGFLRGLVAGTGFVFAARLGTEHVWAQDEPEPTDWVPNVWVIFHPDNTLTITAHRSEMGTGVRTTLPTVLADELDLDIERIHIRQAPGHQDYGDQNTDGSRSISGSFEKMRYIGARIRYKLEEAASLTTGVENRLCRVRNHSVEVEGHDPLQFSELLAAADTIELPERRRDAHPLLTFKDKADWRYIGKDMKIFDLHDLTVGAGQFAADVTPEGCLYAVVARSPVLGGVTKSVDDTEALKVPGVLTVVEMPFAEEPFQFKALGGVAVIATNTYAAIKGRDALVIEWDNGPAGANAKYDSATYRSQIEARVLQSGRRSGPDTGKNSLEGIQSGMAKAHKTHSAQYYLPHLAHAPMEPPACVAQATDNGVEIWACVQDPQSARGSIAIALKLKAPQVTVNVTLLGGGFGRKSKPDFCVEAAWLSREVGSPIKLQWTREDDLHHAYYHSVAATSLQAGVDEKGALTAWLGRSACPPIMSTFQKDKVYGLQQMRMGFNTIPYACPNVRAEACEAPAHVRIGWLRSVGHVFHGFSICSFTDELAQMQNADPIEYLTGLIDASEEGSHEARLKALALYCKEQSNYGESLPEGQAHGFAMHSSFRSHVAVIAQVAVSKTGAVTYPRVDIAIDCGMAVNPDRVKAQMEGSVLFGLTLLHHGSITAKNGAIEQGNFDTYPVARINETPKAIHVHILNSGHALGGVGEPGVPPVAPAIVNAIARITGKRIRSLPLRDHDLSWS